MYASAFDCCCWLAVDFISMTTSEKGFNVKCIRQIKVDDFGKQEPHLNRGSVHICDANINTITQIRAQHINTFRSWTILDSTRSSIAFNLSLCASHMVAWIELWVVRLWLWVLLLPKYNKINNAQPVTCIVNFLCLFARDDRSICAVDWIVLLPTFCYVALLSSIIHHPYTPLAVTSEREKTTIDCSNICCSSYRGSFKFRLINNISLQLKRGCICSSLYAMHI